MGAVLKGALGDNYTAVGLSFADGRYSSYGPATPYPAEPAYDGTHERLLIDAGLDGRFLRLADVPPNHPLRDARGWRFVGSRPQEFGQFLPTGPKITLMPSALSKPQHRRPI